MKRKITVLLATAVVVAGVLAGCGGGSAAPASSSKAASSAAPAATSSAAASSAAASSAAAQSNVLQVPMKVVNTTPVDIVKLYVSASGRNDWGDDLLKGETLSKDTQIQLTFGVDADNLLWDLRAEDKDAGYREFKKIDISDCDTSGGTITLSEKNGEYSAKAE